jgi:hypothetical protein
MRRGYFSQVDNALAIGEMPRESPAYRGWQLHPGLTREARESSFNGAGCRTRQTQWRAVPAIRSFSVDGDGETLPFRTHDIVP